MAERLVELVRLPNSGGGPSNGHLVPVITDCNYSDLDELWVDGLNVGGVIFVDHPDLQSTFQYRLRYYASGAPGSAVAITGHTGMYWLPQGAGTLTTIIATADRTLVAGDSGSRISNTGASGAVTITLPAAIPGLFFEFLVEAAQQLRIDPVSTGESIALPSTGAQSTGGKYIWADAATEYVRIYCNTAGQWDVIGYSGTWTAEP
jgi:hypothetical protein